ncbi:TPA: DUF4405 domain-containing protein [Candidatus Woesearchaeota archaeon]|nr:DUF4405 domain-containing protein [Candidatus Woesearchaeota archaeon]
MRDWLRQFRPCKVITCCFALFFFLLTITTAGIVRFAFPAGNGNEEALLWGISGTSWRIFHWYISLTFAIFLILFIILNWRWIQDKSFETICSKIEKKGKKRRK